MSNLSVIMDENGRFIVTDIVLYRKEYHVVCVYAPNSVSGVSGFSKVC